MFAVPSFFGYNTTFVNGPVATAATGVGETSFTANWNAFAGATYYLLDVSTSPSFSSFVLQDEFTTSTSYVVIGLTASTTYYYRVRANVGVDPDAQAFFDRVTTAGGTLSATEQTATNQLVLDMKAAGVWTKMKAVYPMVGASAAACAQNLKSASFTGTFTSGWTFASTGVTGNGSSTYMDTSLTPSGSLSQNSTHLSFYSRTTGDLSSTFVEMGSYGNSSGGYATYLVTSYSSTIYPNLNSAESSGGSTPYTNRLGFKMFNRVDSSNVRVFNNGTFLQSYSRTSTTLNNLSLYVGAYHRDDTTTLSNNLQCAFASIGDGLTDTQASNFYTAVQAFQTTLSRQV